MGIHVYQSQRLDVLAQAFLTQISTQSDQPLEILKAQHIIVPNPAIEQWLSQYLAEQQGISANQTYHQRIQTFQWYIYQQVLTDKEQVRQANIPRLVMKWRIYAVLLPLITPEQMEVHDSHPTYALIQRIYDSAIGLTTSHAKYQKKQGMLYWVAEHISRLFSHYMLYRGYCVKGHAEGACTCPHNWLDRWGRGEHLDIEHLINTQSSISLYNLEQTIALEKWQSWLWQTVFHEDFLNIKAIDHAFWDALDANEGAIVKKHLPEQLIVFTLLDLPPNQLYFLRRLAQYIDVVIYHYNPSQEYWADSVDPKWKQNYDAEVKQRFIDKRTAQGKKVSDAEIAAFFEAFNRSFNAESRESRHPLLTRFGKQARDHFSLLAGLSSGEEGEWGDIFIDDYASHLLGQLQSDILFLMEPIQHSYALEPHDQSIQIHVCHSHLRQLEVLKDQLIHWLSEGSTEQPRKLDDILILTPILKDIEPLIRSVFTPPRAGSDLNQVYLPIKIAGIAQIDLSNAWRAVLGRIQLPHGRFQYSEFADWLSLLGTQRFYGIDVQDVERMLTLLSQAGFKRGLDALHLAQQLSEGDQDYRFSFKFALDRLAMGVAVPEHCIALETLSYSDVQPEDFALISVLITMYDHFNERRDWLNAHEHHTGHTVESWLYCLAREVSAFQDQGETILRTVSEVIQKQIRMLTLSVTYEKRQQRAESIGHLDDLSLPLADVIAEIEHNIESQLESAVPSGQITVSQIGQIRPLPYRLVVVLNLESGVFPSRQVHTPFDLMKVLRPVLGDRSRLEDDQGAFLDALLLAQDNIWFFYNGFDANDGEVRQPSSVLQELIDHLAFIVAADDPELKVGELIQVQGLDLPKQLESIYHIHPLQPFDVHGFENPKETRFQDQWFTVASQLQQPAGKREAWVDHALTADASQHHVVLNYQQWLADITFPAQLYLKQLGIKNVRLDDVVENSEPLLLDGLGRYRVRELMQHADSMSDASLLQDQLPVGKVQQSAWLQVQFEHSELMSRLHTYAETPTVTTQQRLQINTHLYLQLQVPKHETTQWVSLQASSARAERCTKVWLEYLLWLSHLNLGEQGQNYQRIVVFSDQTIVNEGLTSNQAQAYLNLWWQAWSAGQVSPLVLPAALLMKAAEKNNALTWLESVSSAPVLDEKSMQSLLKQWNDPQKYNELFSAADDKSSKYHQDWQFILQEQDATALLVDACTRWSFLLYAPIYQYQRRVEE